VRAVQGSARTGRHGGANPRRGRGNRAHRSPIRLAGFAVFFLLFSDIIKHFNHIGQKSLFAPSNSTRLTSEIQMLLEPAIEFGVNDATRGQAIVKGKIRFKNDLRQQPNFAGFHK
jgi:hypothetical protein